MGKNMVEKDRPQIKTEYRPWALHAGMKATDTPSEYVIFIAFPRVKMFTRTRFKYYVVMYIACIVEHSDKEK